jgi:hypothetical protein
MLMGLCAQEQGADQNRLRQYVQRWHGWLHGGLQGRVSTKGRFARIWIRLLKHLSHRRAMDSVKAGTARLDLTTV